MRHAAPNPEDRRLRYDTPLSAPDLLLGFDSDPAHRNIFGLIEENPEMAKAGGLDLAHFEKLVGGRSWVTPADAGAEAGR